MSYQQLRTNLIFLRKRKGLTQDEVGSVIGERRNNYCNWENGRCNPPLEQLEPISQLFGVTIDDLVRHDLTKINTYNQEWLSQQEA